MNFSWLGVWWDGFAHFDISQRLSKVHMCMMAQKNGNKKSEEGYKLFFEKNFFFDQKSSKHL